MIRTKMGRVCDDKSEEAQDVARVHCMQVRMAHGVGLRAYAYMHRMLYLAAQMIGVSGNVKHWDDMTDEEKEKITEHNLKALQVHYSAQPGYDKDCKKAALFFNHLYYSDMGDVMDYADGNTTAAVYKMKLANGEAVPPKFPWEPLHKVVDELKEKGEIVELETDERR